MGHITLLERRRLRSVHKKLLLVFLLLTTGIGLAIPGALTSQADTSVSTSGAVVQVNMPAVGDTARYLLILSELREGKASRLEVEHKLEVTEVTTHAYTVRQKSEVVSASGVFEGRFLSESTDFTIDARKHVSLNSQPNYKFPYAAGLDFAGEAFFEDRQWIRAGDSWTGTNVQFAATKGTKDEQEVVEILGDGGASKGSIILRSGPWPILQKRLIVLIEEMQVGSIDNLSIDYLPGPPTSGSEPPMIEPVRPTQGIFIKTEITFAGR